MVSTLANNKDLLHLLCLSSPTREQCKFSALLWSLFAIHFPSNSHAAAAHDPCPPEQEQYQNIAGVEWVGGAMEPDMEHRDARERQWKGQSEDGRNSPPSCRPCWIPIPKFLSCLEEPSGAGRVAGCVVGVCAVSVSPGRGSQFASDCVITLHFWPPLVLAVFPAPASDSCGGIGAFPRAASEIHAKTNSQACYTQPCLAPCIGFQVGL